MYYYLDELQGLQLDAGSVYMMLELVLDFLF